MEILIFVADKISAPLLTALLLTPLVRKWGKWRNSQEYANKLLVYGGKRVIVFEGESIIGTCKLSVDEAEMLVNILSKLSCLDVSETKARQLLQSVVSGFGKRTDNVLGRLSMTTEGDFEIRL
jgi:hypothetical protein